MADTIKRFGINYPVAQDNDYATWIAYRNEFWPAEYLIDKRGEIVHESFGEGEYGATENTIRALLGMHATSVSTTAERFNEVNSSEMYLGTDRLANLSSEQSPSLSPKIYSFPNEFLLNNFALEGNWQFSKESIRLISGRGKIKLKFHAGKIHLVGSSQSSAELTVAVDGKIQPKITVKDAELYSLFDSDDYNDHIIEIMVETPGFEAITFTFG